MNLMIFLNVFFFTRGINNWSWDGTCMTWDPRIHSCYHYIPRFPKTSRKELYTGKPRWDLISWTLLQQVTWYQATPMRDTNLGLIFLNVKLYMEIIFCLCNYTWKDYDWRHLQYLCWIYECLQRYGCRELNC